MAFDGRLDRLLPRSSDVQIAVVREHLLVLAADLEAAATEDLRHPTFTQRKYAAALERVGLRDIVAFHLAEDEDVGHENAVAVQVPTVAGQFAYETRFKDASTRLDEVRLLVEEAALEREHLLGVVLVVDEVVYVTGDFFYPAV